MNDFKNHFVKKTNEELVGLLNNQVGNLGWVSAKAYYLGSLREEFSRRNIDLSDIINYSGGFNLNKKIRFDNTKIVVIN